MPLHSDIGLLNPDFQVTVRAFLKALDDAGIQYVINETLRDKAVQEAYYAQGREPLVTTNRLRKSAGLWLLSDEENKDKVTWTLQSKHLLGLALDIAPKKAGKVWWTAPNSVWKQIADISTQCGLVAGYYFKSTDSPHHEAKT
jgi:peptidoglycan L-alanyl-D-glutamate endopeptidase CwlK